MRRCKHVCMRIAIRSRSAGARALELQTTCQRIAICCAWMFADESEGSCTAMATNNLLILCCLQAYICCFKKEAVVWVFWGRRIRRRIITSKKGGKSIPVGFRTLLVTFLFYVNLALPIRIISQRHFQTMGF